MYVVVCRTNMRMFGLYCMNEKRIISLSIRKKKTHRKFTYAILFYCSFKLVPTRSSIGLPVFVSTSTDRSGHSPIRVFDFLPLNHDRLSFPKL